MSRHSNRREHGSDPGTDHPPMVEPRINGCVHEFTPRKNPPSECLDDRPDVSTPAVTPTASDAAANLRRTRDDGGQTNPGATLREAREARGLKLEDLSRTTKIARGTLKALEEGNVEKLPATIFTRGFLKAYASEVGLDPEETADLYLARLAPVTLAVDAANARLKVAVATPAVRREVMAYDDDTSKYLADRQAGRLGWLVTAAAVVGLVVYIWSFSWQQPPGTNTPDQSRAQQPAPTDAAPATGAESPASDAAPAALSAIETPIGPLQFQLKPRGPCWVAVAADRNPVFARLLQAGEQQTIEVHDELVLRVGDPAALSFSINGREGRSLGRAGEPVNIRITKENFREFLN